ncbi:MAG: hypothetical protein WAT77_16345 [Paracoccaceae bacterium]
MTPARSIRRGEHKLRGYYGAILALLVTLLFAAGDAEAARKSKKNSREAQQKVITKVVKERDNLSMSEAEMANVLGTTFAAIKAKDDDIKSLIESMRGNYDALNDANKLVGETEAALTQSTADLGNAIGQLKAAQSAQQRLTQPSSAATNSTAPVQTVGTQAQIANANATLAEKQASLRDELQNYRTAKDAYARAIAASQQLEVNTNPNLAAAIRVLRAEQLALRAGLVPAITDGEFGRLSAAMLPQGATQAQGAVQTQGNGQTQIYGQTSLSAALQAQGNNQTQVYGQTSLATDPQNIYGAAPLPMVQLQNQQYEAFAPQNNIPAAPAQPNTTEPAYGETSLSDP